MMRAAAEQPQNPPISDESFEEKDDEERKKDDAVPKNPLAPSQRFKAASSNLKPQAGLRSSKALMSISPGKVKSSVPPPGGDVVFPLGWGAEVPQRNLGAKQIEALLDTRLRYVFAVHATHLGLADNHVKFCLESLHGVLCDSQGNAGDAAPVDFHKWWQNVCRIRSSILFF